MSEKYTIDHRSHESTSLLTNDIYLAAFLSARSCRLVRILRNDRRRVSFEFEGNNVRDLRRAYRRGPVYVSITNLRDKLTHLRRHMYAGNERSTRCPRRPVLNPAEASPMQSSRA